MQEREKRLLGLLLLALLFVASWFLWGYFSQTLKGLRTAIAQEEATKETHIMRRNQIGDWLPRRDWLDTNQPRIQDGVDPMGNLENFAINSALSEGLELTRPADPRGENLEATHISYSLDLSVKGDWGSLVRWLASLQDRDRFVVLTRCEIMPVKRDSDEIRCNTRIERWYALEDGMVVAVVPPTPAPEAEGQNEPDGVSELPPGVGPDAGASPADGDPVQPSARVMPPDPGPGDAVAAGQSEPDPEDDPVEEPQPRSKPILPPKAVAPAPQPATTTEETTEETTSTPGSDGDIERPTRRRRRVVPGRRSTSPNDQN